MGDQTMNDQERRQDLLKDLEDDYDEYFGGGRFNNIADVILTTLTVVTSLAATVLAATTQPSWITASVAALPAAIAAVQSKVDVRGRAVWYFQCAAHVSGLVTTLKYATAPEIDDIVSKRAEMEVAMEKEWSQIGRSAAAASKKRGKR